MKMFRYRVEDLGEQQTEERSKVLFDTFSFKKKYEGKSIEGCFPVREALSGRE